MSIFSRRRRAVTGADFRFAWTPPDGYPASDPTLSVRWPGGAQSYALSPVRAADTVTALSEDGRDLTISCSVTQPGSTLRGLIDEYGGHAWLDGGAEYQGPVRVLQLVSQTALTSGGPGLPTGTAVLRLAEQLPALSIVSQKGTAAGSVTLQAGHAAQAEPGGCLTIFGAAFEYDEMGGGGDGYYGRLIDLESSPGVRCSDAVLAGRIAACIEAAGIGVTATVDGLVITLEAAHNGDVVILGDQPGNAALVSRTNISGAATAWTLRWTGYTALIAGADVGGSVARAVPWSVAWTMAAGEDGPTQRQVDKGLLDVVAIPFATGLTDEHLFTLIPGWRRLVPEGQSSWASQRLAALDDLEDLLRPRLPAGKFVDQLLGEQFRQVHALLTAARILQGLEALGVAPNFVTNAPLERLREDAAKALDACMSRLTWIDLNNDGAVTANELGVGVQGVRNAARSTFLDSGFDRSAQLERAVNPWDDR